MNFILSLLMRHPFVWALIALAINLQQARWLTAVVIAILLDLMLRELALLKYTYKHGSGIETIEREFLKPIYRLSTEEIYAYVPKNLIEVCRTRFDSLRATNKTSDLFLWTIDPVRIYIPADPSVPLRSVAYHSVHGPNIILLNEDPSTSGISHFTLVHEYAHLSGTNIACSIRPKLSRWRWYICLIILFLVGSPWHIFVGAVMVCLFAFVVERDMSTLPAEIEADTAAITSIASELPNGRYLAVSIIDSLSEVWGFYSKNVSQLANISDVKIFLRDKLVKLEYKHRISNLKALRRIIVKRENVIPIIGREPYHLGFWLFWFMATLGSAQASGKVLFTNFDSIGPVISLMLLILFNAFLFYTRIFRSVREHYAQLVDAIEVRRQVRDVALPSEISFSLVGRDSSGMSLVNLTPPPNPPKGRAYRKQG